MEFRLQKCLKNKNDLFMSQCHKGSLGCLLKESMRARAHQPLSKQDYFVEQLRIHHREILVYARSLAKEQEAAKDIAQDAFVTAWEHLDVFDVTRDFGAWMRGIVRNKWREWLRLSKRSINVDDSTLEYFEAEMKSWEANRQRGGSSLFIALEACLSDLPETLSVAVKAFYRDDLDTKDAAEQVGVQHATFRKRLERARVALRNCIEERMKQKEEN